MTEELFRLIDGKKRCSACEEGDLYLGTYIGPLYCFAKHKVAFIGLDQGNDKDKRSLNLRERQKDMIELPSRPGKDGKWNPHYRGCIKVASYLLDSACLYHCTSRCALRAEPPPSLLHTTEADCIFLQFAQGNAVKCVPRAVQDSTFRGHKRISKCLPLMFEELAVLRPNVIVLQGRNSLYQPLCQLATKDGVEWETTAHRHVGIARWPTWQSVIVSLNHPARGLLERNWDGDIVPALDEARKHLRA